MPARQITPHSQIEGYLNNRLERGRKAILESLANVGEVCVTEARTAHTYMDRSGNLTSSMGYAVLNNGRSFGKGQFIGKEEGIKNAKKFLGELARKNSSGIVLVVVAGMNYAVYVEAKSFNVLSSSELLASRMVPNLMKQLGFIQK